MRMPGMIRPQGVAMPPPGFPGMFPPGFVGGKTCLFIVSPVLTNAMAAYVIIKNETIDTVLIKTLAFFIHLFYFKQIDIEAIFQQYHNQV